MTAPPSKGPITPLGTTYQGLSQPQETNPTSTDRQRSRNTPGRRHEYYLTLRAKGYYKTVCECGAVKSRSAKRCAKCGNAKRQKPERPRTTKRAVKRKAPLNPFCPNPREERDICACNFPHKHCGHGTGLGCGLPIKLDEVVCQLCIREQARVERAMTGKRWRGDALEDVA